MDGLGGWKGNIEFGIQHIKKIYPLHIITMLMVLILNLVELLVAHSLTVMEICKLGFKTVLNVLLIQSWIPSVSINVSLNGVAWFLSSIFFCYCMFPMMHKRFRNQGKKSLGVIVISVVLLQFAITAVMVQLNVKEDIFRWATYDAPFFRLGDFAIGMVTGTLVARRRGKKIEHGKLLIVLIAGFGLAVNIWDTFSSHTGFVSKVLNNYTTIYIPIAAALVFMAAQERNMLSTNKVLLYIGEKSGYYFLIHYAVVRVTKSVMRMNGMEPVELWIVVLMIAAVMTYIVTIIYGRIAWMRFKKNTI